MRGLTWCTGSATRMLVDQDAGAAPVPAIAEMMSAGARVRALSMASLHGMR